MKRRLIAGGLALSFFLWLSLVVSSNLGLLLARKGAGCTLRLSGMIAAIQDDARGGKLLVLLSIASVLLVLWMLFGRSYLNYKSDMYEVVPGFSIPRPEGQGQHGTAWFMSVKKFPICFASVNGEGGVALPPALTARYGKERSAIDAADCKAD